MNRFRTPFALALLLAGLALVGCSAKKDESPSTPPGREQPAAPHDDEFAAERAKLSPEDRALVEAQEWCVISNDERLGSMGPPVKLDIKGEPVFICCKGCKRKAEADPDATLAKAKELKAKAKAERDARN